MARKTLHLLALLLAVALPCAAAFGIQPAEWVHTSEADFQDGETDNTVVTNLGDVKLATGSETIQELPEEGSIIYDLQPIPGESVYIAAGPEATLMQQTDDGAQTIAELPDEQVFALDVTPDGQLLLAISGSPSRLAVLDDEGEVQTLVELENVRYIWDVIVQEDSYILATGTEGQVLRVRPDAFDAEQEENPGLEVLLETKQDNILCLAHDAERNRIFAGTDGEGLIYRVTFDDAGEPVPFVVYDAPEPEIGALLIKEDGTLYAGTADAEQARPGRLEEAQAEPAGRPGEPAPDGDEPEQPEAPADPDDVPQVPPEPEPRDGEAPQDNGEDGADNGEQPNGANGEAPADDNAAPATQPDENAQRPEVQQIRDGFALSDADGRVPEPFTPYAAQQPATQPAESEDDAQPAEDEAGEAEQASAEQEQPAEPTQEQRDRLREEIRSRLEAARDGGEMQVQPGGMQQAGPGGSSAPSRARPVERNRRSEQGNAIYRIDDEGFVTEVFRDSVMILRLVEAGDRLLVATGNEGQIYSVDPAAEETTMLVDLEPQQVPALLPGGEGRVLVGTANPAKLMALDRRFAARGTFVSPVMDAEQISLWGKLKLTADVPEDTAIHIETRSGNVRDPEQGPWSQWSQAQALMPDENATPLQPRSLSVDAAPARFVQYRIVLTGNQTTTPALNRVALAYVTPNMAPGVASIAAEYPEQRGNNDEGPSTTMNIEWEASDANDDELRYKLEYRPAGSERFLPIEDDIDSTDYEWQTRRVPDGRYVIRVTASDHTDNPGDMAESTNRVSDPVLVDNTAPVFEGLDQQAQAGGVVTLSGEAVDEFSAIAEMGYAVDDAESYEPILPDDLIFDSTHEAWSIRLAGLAPGQHVVTLRVRDGRGNTTHKAMLVEVE